MAIKDCNCEALCVYVADLAKKNARIKELEDKLKLAVEAISAGMPFMEKWLASCDGSTPHEDATHLMRQALASLRDGEGKETGK
jgi:hypothetical protein